ncbi:hypothetical protein MYCTH_2296362 [Thermothelomyces thermophilus ATCC 42464]|uniref:Phospholipase/carboxylesterase/thioesterase domain-containing protein n=1 Tax=Thermothelomyces thermophilus (strain ATCC 42464 / BCRC 31852 / DSM 1799) TaxID=573729 RepID=G2Q1F5_THET4|nr:uncharacterized protein MYCTH_2296362 [Thermothelomyces thermophilus ATCC 42464]AEO54145.1 hypothetical protein MYCTH_2296362 [Thermothelomyces thermophilus ATCC 42464]
MDGIRKSIAYIQSVLSPEAATLGGKKEKVVLMGISQGAAICHVNAAVPGEP